MKNPITKTIGDIIIYLNVANGKGKVSCADWSTGWLKVDDATEFFDRLDTPAKVATAGTGRSQFNMPEVEK